jgi:hypothetical protein
VFNRGAISNIIHNSADTCDPKLEQFKQFAKIFFSSVKANDTIFLKRHIVFPIPTRQFSNYDRSLIGAKTINSQTFFKKLHKLIPDYQIRRMNEAEYSISNFDHTEYFVSLYSTTDGVDSNCNWIFVEKSGEFYFEMFTAEAG